MRDVAISMKMGCAMLVLGLCALACERPDAKTMAIPQRGQDTRLDGASGMRGITIGPIENAYHPGVGYGSPAYLRTLDECKRMGATWVALTPFGRVADLHAAGVDLTFETPFELNFPRVLTAIEMAHARGLKVMLVPHLWVESGEWRALIDPGTEEGWARWAASYRSFVLAWAKVAEMEHAEMFSAGVELRSWVTNSRATSFFTILNDIRAAYHGKLTYSANWDDVDDTLILGALDVIGINAFYPLADHNGATDAELLQGGRHVRERVHALAAAWGKPVLFAEVGYTTRPDPAVRPWEWPDSMQVVDIDQRSQASAYRALIAPELDEPSFAGFFVWRVFSDPDDVSQEAEWGFSPRGKLAELVMRDAFAARWVGEGTGWGRAAQVPGVYP
jgi:hypothetical protein